MISIAVIAAAVVLLLAGVPIFAVIAAATAFCMALFGDYPATIMIQQIFSMAEKKELLAIPLFIMASTFMTRGESAS